MKTLVLTILSSLMLAVLAVFAQSEAFAWGGQQTMAPRRLAREERRSAEQSPKAYCLPSDSVADGTLTPPTATPTTTPTTTTSTSATPTPTTSPTTSPTASPTSVATATPSATPTGAATGYPILLQNGHGDTGVLSAEVYFGSAQSGRSRLAGYADVQDASAASSTAGTQSTASSTGSANSIDLVSTSASPFHFELTISSTQDPDGAFESELVDADLFTGAPLTNIAYKCWFKR